MNNQELEQIILAIGETSLMISQLFINKKIKEGVTKINTNQDKLENIYNDLSNITYLLTVLEDGINDLVQQLNTFKDD